MKIRMNETTGEIMVGAALALRGSSLLFSSIAMRTMGPFLLMGTRFLIAFVVIGLLFRDKLVSVTKKELFHCALLGFGFFLSIFFELKGLQTTPTTVTSFLEGAVVAIVPVLTCILARKLPDKVTVLSVVFAMTGIGFLTLKGDHLGFSVGEMFIILDALFYSITVLITDWAAKNDDPMTVAIYQLLFIALFAFIGAFMFEDIRLPESGTEWGAILALALICSGVGFTLQPLGQKYITPERAGLLAAANPLSATTLGVIFLGEKITPSILAGAVLILISIFLPAWIKDRQTKKEIEQVPKDPELE